jgi:hypothetical protein
MRSLLLAVFCLLLCGSASAQTWQQYKIIEWQGRTAEQLATLKRIGVEAGAVVADRDGTGVPLSIGTAPLRQAGLRWYIENAATDFYSAYHRWTKGKPVNWLFLKVQQQYRTDPTDNAALIRDPSLLDPHWQAHIRDRLIHIVREESRYHPLFYNLGDETGIADLSAFWDFDLSPESIAGMRVWLRQQYGSLAALNAEWGTHYTSWNAVQPEITRAAMRRTDGNFSAWNDFKAWMDVSFARALRVGTDAIHSADPQALAAIEGAQMPGWGGYDYTLLAHAVDLMEVYDMGENMPILRSLNPRLIELTTSFDAEPADVHQIWRELLRGSRGLILWDSDYSIVHRDGSLGDRGEAYIPLFKELHRIGPLIINSTPHTDPIAILYSPASFRTQWMLDQQPKGDAWIDRGAEKENEDNAWRAALRGYVRSLSQLGLAQRFVSAAMLPGLDDRVLILPDTLDLSAADARAVAAFAARGGTVIADRQPGLYDGHSKRLARPDVPEGIVHIVAPDARAALGALVAKAHVIPPVRFTADQPNVEMHVFTHGSDTIVALQRDTPGDGTEAVTLTLPRAMWVMDLRTGRSLGLVRKLDVSLGPIAPTLLFVSATPHYRG